MKCPGSFAESNYRRARIFVFDAPHLHAHVQKAKPRCDETDDFTRTNQFGKE